MSSLFDAVCRLLLLVCTAACRERIQHGLDERQANELQTVLVERGLDARKVPEAGKKPTWAIEVSEEQASDAVRILAELGLPRPAAETGCDVFGGGAHPLSRRGAAVPRPGAGAGNGEDAPECRRGAARAGAPDGASAAKAWADARRPRRPRRCCARCRGRRRGCASPRRRCGRSSREEWRGCLRTRCRCWWTRSPRGWRCPPLGALRCCGCACCWR